MLYFIATPIGNLKDISLRALETLKEVDVIACEDTRVSIKLLNHYEIKKPLITYHKFNEQNSAKGIINLLKEGKNVAVISDSGMPCISDPGETLAKLLVEENIDFTVIPGANAGLSALILSGFNSKSFSFIGFLSENKKEKINQIKNIKNFQGSLIFYISPHNLFKDISFLNENLGNRKACLVNEITKKFEKKFIFNLNSLPEIEPRGEYVLVVEGAEDNNENTLNSLSLEEHINYYLSQGYNKNEAIKKVGKDRKIKNPYKNIKID